MAVTAAAWHPPRQPAPAAEANVRHTDERGSSAIKLLKYILLVLIIIFVNSFTANCISAETIDSIPTDLISSADTILFQKFINGAEYYKESLPYFHESDSLCEFKLGTPYPFYILHKDILYGMGEDGAFKDALELSCWHIPILLGDDSSIPRTYVTFRKNDNGDWEYVGMGGDPVPMQRARDKWPTDEGFAHAEFRVSGNNIFLIAIENDQDVIFWYFNDNDEAGRHIFNLNRESDGSWPAMSQEYFTNLIRSKYYLF